MKPVVAVEGEVDGEPLGLQPALDRTRETPFVFHYQDAHGPSLALGHCPVQNKLAPRQTARSATNRP